jgi:hypothetical protein
VSEKIKLLAVWGPFRCGRCEKQRANWEGRCYFDPETGTRTAIWCLRCWAAVVEEG